MGKVVQFSIRNRALSPFSSSSVNDNDMPVPPLRVLIPVSNLIDLIRCCSNDSSHLGTIAPSRALRMRKGVLPILRGSKPPLHL
jgi:hypothetical protein